MFLLTFVKGSKSEERGKNPLADKDPGGPDPLADMERGSISGGTKSARTPRRQVFRYRRTRTCFFLGRWLVRWVKVLNN